MVCRAERYARTRGAADRTATASITQYYHDWLDKNGFPWWPFWENIQSWWDIRALPNVLLLHFANLKRDLPGEIRRVAEFIDTPIDEARWESIVTHCSFDYMKTNATKSVPLAGAFWDGGDYLGRRMPEEDRRQIKRWKAMRRHVRQVEQNCERGDIFCRPRQRQALLHWAYDSRKI